MSKIVDLNNTENKIAYVIGFDAGFDKALSLLEDAMYYQAFECDNDPDMQKWDSGNWIRFKLFEEVIDKVRKDYGSDAERDIE